MCFFLCFSRSIYFQVNFVEVISDAMYSDSAFVVEALAEFIENTVSENDETPRILEEQMTQVRYLLQVDEASFQANFTAEQLKTIESKEMYAIVDDLVSAIGLQRFRFTERQNSGKSTCSRHANFIKCVIYYASMLVSTN